MLTTTSTTTNLISELVFNIRCSKIRDVKYGHAEYMLYKY